MKKFFLLLLLLFLFLYMQFPLADEKPFQKYSYMFFDTFDTAITLIGYAESKETFNDAARMTEELFIKYHKQFDLYHSYQDVNNLYYLNRHASIAPVKVPKELFDLIAWCKEAQKTTLDKVNIALGSVLSLWHDAREIALHDPENAQLPTMKKLQNAMLHTNMDDVILNREEQTIFYQDSKLHLDVGAVAKGYATELVAKALLSSNMPHFIINAGGNVRTGLPPLDGRKHWSVGIQDPNANLGTTENAAVMDVLFLSEMSVVTSGDYQRYFTLNGIRYHHLIDPATLMPAHHMRSVSIMTEDSAWADLLSTAVFLMPFEEGYSFIQSLDGVEAYWILNDLTVKMTPGAEKMAASMGVNNK